MKKYIDLFIKDIAIYRNIFVIFAAFITYMNFLTFFLFPIDQFISFTNISLLETSMFFVLYKLESQKNRGEEFLLTTQYTRKNIIISRFALAFLCVIFEFATYFCGKFLIHQDEFIISAVLNQLLFSYILTFILIPLSFMKNVKWLSVGSIIMIYVLWKFENIFALACFPTSVIIITLLTFIVSVLSLKVSNRIFLSQDF